MKMLSILKSLQQMPTTGRRLCAKHTFAFDSKITYSSGLPQIPGSGKDIAHLHKAISVAIPPQKKTKYWKQLVFILFHLNHLPSVLSWAYTLSNT